MPDLLVPPYLGELRVLREAEPPRQPLPIKARLALVLVAILLIVAAILGGNWQQAWWAPRPGDLPPGPLLEPALADEAPLRGNTVCLAEGSPYRHSIIAEQGAVARSYPSSVHAIAAFMAGECAALAEEESLIAWLLQQPDWRFYRRLPIALRPGDAGHVRLPAGEPQTRTWLAAALADWQLRGVQDSALAHWIGELSVDVLKLEQGLICH